MGGYTGELTGSATSSAVLCGIALAYCAFPDDAAVNVGILIVADVAGAAATSGVEWSVRHVVFVSLAR